jgi:hypothetical protein
MRLPAIAFIAVLGACGGARRPDAGEPAAAARVIAAGLAPTPAMARAPELTRLPPAATFAWVAPSRHFQGAGPDEDDAARASLRGYRETVTTVLRANDWREVPAAEAQYHLVMAQTTREARRDTWMRDPRNDREPREVCTTTRTGQVCHTPQAPRYPPIRSTEPYEDRRLGYAIVRAQDGAMKWWVLQLAPRDAERFIARVTVELLLVEDRDPGR